MEEKRTLRLRYIHSDYVDIVVEDLDKCNLLDILAGLIEESGKIGMFLPEHPTLWYAHNSQSFHLESDDDVLKMFTAFLETKIIKLVIGSAELPSKNLELARGLIESKKHVENSVLPNSSHGSQPISSRRVPKTSSRRKGLDVQKSISSSPSVASRPISGDLSRTDVVLPDVVLSDVVLPETVLEETVFLETEAAEIGVLNANLFEADIPTSDVRRSIDPYVPEIESDSEVESDTSNEGVHEDYFLILTCHIMLFKAFGHKVKTCKGGATARELKEQGIRVQLNRKKKAKEIQSVENVMCSAPSVPASQ